MVEMLGVLAIVGVLSVGGIAGYSKAMMKYKLNKQAQQLNQLITAMTRYKNEWKFNEFTYLKDYYIKLGEIPKEMIKDNNTVYIYDVFGNQIYLRNNHAPMFDTTILRIYLLGNKDFSVCQNIIQTAKEHSAVLNLFGVWYTASDSLSENNGKLFYGNSRCEPNQKCLRNITLNEIKEQCQICEDATKNKQCSFVFSWMIDD